MTKRFTATEKWVDPWFCSLNEKDKLFWFYLLDNCNHAGVWQVNWPLVKFHIKGFVFNPECFKDRIFELSVNKWYIPKFIDFQYGTLNSENRAHKSVIDILEKEGASKGLLSPLQGRKDMDMVKDKDKELVKDKVKHLDRVFLTEKEYLSLVEKFTEKGTKDRIEELNTGIMSKGYKYDSHYHTILSWEKRKISENNGKLKTQDHEKRFKETQEYLKNLEAGNR